MQLEAQIQYDDALFDELRPLNEEMDKLLLVLGLTFMLGFGVAKVTPQPKS
jgi:hypothetical protein